MAQITVGPHRQLAGLPLERVAAAPERRRAAREGAHPAVSFPVMPGRADGTRSTLRDRVSRSLWSQPSGPRQRIVVLATLLLLVTAAFVVVNQPGLAIYMYALIPLVLGVHWFELRGGIAVATAATLAFVTAQLVRPSTALSGTDVWVAAVNRAVVYVGVAVLVTV